MSSGFLVLMNGQRVPVSDGLTIGRHADCQVVLDDAKCSRHHARLFVESGVIEIEDLQSSNGTLLNGRPVQRRMLRDGDEVQIGATTLRFTTLPEPSRTPLAAARPVPEAARVEPRGPPPPVEVIEFMDETVELRAPAPVPGQPAGTVPARDARGFLQFSKDAKAKSKGVLGDDLRQMSSLQRTAMVVIAIAVAAALGWVVMRTMS